MRETIYNDIKYVIGQNAKENYNILALLNLGSK